MYLLLENSLFSNQAEKDAFTSDHFRLMDAFIFSFIGVVGLFQINDKSPLLMKHIRDEKKLVLMDVKDDNNDASLIIKLCQQAKLIPAPYATKMIVFLRQIKMRALSGDDVTDDMVRDLLSFSKHHLAGPVMIALDDFMMGKTTLAKTTAKLYALARSPRYSKVSGEFFFLARRGGFSNHFHAILRGDTSTVPGGQVSGAVAQAAKTATPSAASSPTRALKNPSNVLPDVWTHDTIQKILDIKTEREAKELFEDNGYATSPVRNNTQRMFPWRTLLEWIHKNKNDVIPNQKIMRHGVFTLIPANWKPVLTAINNTAHWKETKTMVADPIAFVKAWRGWDHPSHQHMDIINRSGILSMQDTVVNDPDFKSDYEEALKTITVNAIKMMKSMGVRPFAQIYKEYVDLIYNLRFGRDSQVKRDILIQPLWSIDPLAQILMSTQIFDEVVNKIYKCNPIANTRMRSWLIQELQIEDSQVIESNDIMSINITRNQYEGMKDGMKWFVDVMLKSKTHSARKPADQRKFALDFKLFENDIAKQALDLWVTADIKDSKFIYRFAEDLFSVGTRIRNLDSRTLDTLAKSVIQGLPGNIITILNSTRKSQIGIFDVITEFILKMALRIGELTDGLGSEALYKTLVFASESKIYKELVFKQILRPESNAIHAMAQQVSKFAEGEWALNDETFAEIVDILAERQDKVDITSHFLRMVYERLGIDDVIRFKIQDGHLAGDIYFTIKNNPSMQKYCTEIFSQYPILRQKAILYFKTLRPETVTPAGFISGAYNIVHIEEPGPEIIQMFRASFDNVSSWRGETGRRDDFSPNEVFLKIFDEEVRRKAEETSSWPATLTYLGPCLSENELDAKVMQLAEEDKLFGTTAEDGKFVAQFLSDTVERGMTLSVPGLSSLAKKIETQIELYLMKDGDLESCLQSFSSMLTTAFNRFDKDSVEKVFDELPPAVKTKVVSIIGSKMTFMETKDAINNDIIRPLNPITAENLPKILEYNRIKLPSDNLNSIKDIIEAVEEFNASLKPLAVTNSKKTKLELLQKTIEYDAFNRYKHGMIGVEFLDEFDVDLPGNKEAYDQFVEEHPSTEFITPAFHGTGSIAASFILRYGFTVVPSGAAGVVGRMLGDGIYFTNVLDKASQYVSDEGFSRGQGQEGYLLEGIAALGEKGVDYQSAGLGANSTYHYQTVSPEWCVVDPHAQLWVKKVYKIRLTTQKDILNIRKKLALYEDNVTPIIHFREYLGEAKASETRNTISYLFMDGEIPVSAERRVKFEDFDVSQYGGRVTIETSQFGPVVRIAVENEPSATYAVRYTHKLVTSESQINRFLNLLDSAGRPRL